MPDMLNMDPFFLGVNGPSKSLQINTGEVAVLFEGKTILHPSLASNEVGCFTTASVGNNGVVNWSRLTGPKHLFKARQNGCTWDPKGMVRVDTDKVTLAPIEIQLEQCVDALWTSAWEKLLGTGRQIRNIVGTPEGQKMLAYIVNRVFGSMRNSTSNLVWWGKNAFIDAATTAHSYTVDEPEWTDFVEQQDLIAGFHTLIAAGAATNTAWDVDIASGDVSGGKYTAGSNAITKYFNDLYDASTPELQALYDQEPEKVALYVSPSLWKAYRDYLISTYGNIGESYYLLTDGVPNRRVLMFDDIEVIAMREWSEFDRIVGVNSHIAYLAAKGVFGVAYDVDSLDEMSGIGLEITTWDKQPYKGKTFMDSDFKLGAAILDQDLISRAHITV